jgi:ketosteroid isomerase-like protein
LPQSIDTFFIVANSVRTGGARVARSRPALVESSDGLVVHHTQDSPVVILEYEVHGKIVATGEPYDNRFISVITIETEKIVCWRDYMDSLAAWTALNRDRP